MDYNPILYNTFLNTQNNIDLREINRLLKEIIKLKEENIRLQKIIDDNEDDEKMTSTTEPHGEKGAV